MLIGGIHGDELASVSIVFRWMSILNAMRTQPHRWRVIPALNPDGLLLRRASRMNANGVDLNRNFATPNWDEDALPYWRKITRQDRRRYPGPFALSEPESRWLVAQIAEFRPDVIISVHAPLALLDFDGPPPPPDQLGFLRLKNLGIYPGSLGNYAGVHLNIPILTPELPHAGIMPSNSQLQRIWTDLNKWLDQRTPKADELPLFLSLDRTSWSAEKD